MKRSRIDMPDTTDLGEAIDAMRKRTVSLAWLAALTGLLALTSCDSATNSGMGTVRLHLSSVGAEEMIQMATLADASFSSLTSASVTIVSAELMPGQVNIPLDGDRVYDLLRLSKDTIDLDVGVAALLGQVRTLGRYEQLRLVVGEAWVTIGDNPPQMLRTPSGGQSGIKVNFAGPIEVGTDAVVDLIAEFSLPESFVFLGPPEAPRGVLFTPVIHASTTEAGSLLGNVSLSAAPSEPVEVTIEALLGEEVMAAVEVTATTTDAVPYELRYLVPGVAYTVRARATGYTTVTALDSYTVNAGENDGPDLTLTLSGP